jgi:NAD(P)-dependent dehydrogenase (short-subunit alcohol dehydrogenase family)
VVADIVAAGGAAAAIEADVADEIAVMRLFDEAVALFGRVAGLVNNAAITGGFSPVGEIDPSRVRRMLDVNLVGTMLCCREAVWRMSTARGGQGGAIVNISSLAAKTGGSHEWVHYAASKGAINTFTVGMAREVATEGIRVNAVAPGLIESDLHADNGDPGRPARMAPSIPMQRSGEPEEIAEGVVWLLSPAASYVTGTILEIGGGR